MTIREFFLENFAGDLEYHPRRAVLYLTLGAIAFCSWLFSPKEGKFTVIPLVVVLGSLTLLLKGIFLLRKSSEGLGLSQQEITALFESPKRKSLPSIPAQAAQIAQDFGSGARFCYGQFLTSERISTNRGATRHSFVFFSREQFCSFLAGLSVVSRRRRRLEVSPSNARSLAQPDSVSV